MGNTETIQTVALTAEMVINAFSMARQEVHDMMGKTANTRAPLRLIIGGKITDTDCAAEDRLVG